MNFEFLILNYGIFLNRRFKKGLNSKLKTSNLKLGCEGFSLVEMLVVLAILSVLAAVTVPYAEVTVRRDKELDLRRDLREMRTAIDHFHRDWQDGIISKFDNQASDDGYPKSFLALTAGVDNKGPRAVKQKYLRRVPENPFGDTDLPPEEQWGLKSYQDRPDAAQWGGQDLYDVYCPGDGKALDGSFYHDW
ncbi:MAG TPA: prepilin-type N-terminal cleavage/methylation domain-containing protein [bacterium]|jgi:general secretion pathway protein G|nr:prepilin-type N-terminal cleavage/methylation domain-containing protein [bacterium]